MAKKQTNNQSKISELTASNIDVKVIEKLALVKDHSYLLFFKVGTMPFEQANNLAQLLADAGFKALFVAVQDTKGIKIIERPNEVATVAKTAKKAAAPKKSVN